MNAPLDELYLTWLYSQVGSTRTRSKERTYWHLLRQLYTTEFVWLIPNDDNRVNDGKELRDEFLDDHHIRDVDPHWMNEPCSFLEMMIALSRRIAFQVDGKTRDWFWHLIENLDLQRCNDAYFNEQLSAVVTETVDRVIWRQFYFNGHGGLFPLRNPERDQRKVEIWYQMHAYLIENNL
jgi:hypothetical protein